MVTTKGEKLYQTRKAKNYTRADIAKLTGINDKLLFKYEKDIITNIPLENLEKLCTIYGISPSYIVGWENPDSLSPSCDNSTKGVKIPLLGRVVAGVPLEAIENIEGYEEITPALAAKGSYFALRVTGKSMEPFFLENDIVIVRKTKSIESGAIAIVLVNGNEATVKKVKIQENGVTLIGFNTSVYEPHFYNSEEVKTLPLEIIGQVVESKRILVNV